MGMTTRSDVTPLGITEKCGFTIELQLIPVTRQPFFFLKKHFCPAAALSGSGNAT